MDIHEYLSNHQDDAACTLLHKDHVHAAEVRFSLGDWSARTMAIRHASSCPNIQARLRCDQAFLFCIGHRIYPPHLGNTPEECLWKETISHKKIPSKLIPNPIYGWQSSFRIQKEDCPIQPQLVRQCSILHTLGIDPRPWLQQQWNNIHKDISILFSFAVLGIHSPFAQLYSCNALLLLQELFPHPLWNLLSTYYKRPSIPDLTFLSPQKNDHSLFLLHLSKEILHQKSSPSLIHELVERYPLLKECSVFRPSIHLAKNTQHI